jgi:hypothetical protein
VIFIREFFGLMPTAAANAGSGRGIRKPSDPRQEFPHGRDPKPTWHCCQPGGATLAIFVTAKSR